MGKRIVVPDDDLVRERTDYVVANDRVGVRLGVTRNLGDYNSLVFQTWREADVTGSETADDTTERLYRACEAKVEAVVEEYSD